MSDVPPVRLSRAPLGGGLPSNCRIKNGQAFRNGEFIPTPEEPDFLSFLGLPPDLTPFARAALVPETWRMEH